MCRNTFTLFILWAMGAVLLLPSNALAQQPTQFSQFQLTQFYFNPAAAGAGGITQFQLMHRVQYQGYQPTIDNGGAPSTQFFAASTAIKNLGVGFTAYNDRLGALSNQSFQLAAAYRFVLGGGGTLAVGASAGIYRQSLNFNLLRFEDDGDELIPQGIIAQAKPDINVGIRYEAPGYYVGLSVNHLVKSPFSFGTETGISPLKPAYFLNGGLTLEVGYLLEVQPFALVKTDLSSYSAEGGAMATYNKRYWAGISYRSQDAAILMAGINMLPNQSLRLSGAYDFVIGAVSAKASSSYEVLLSYRMPAPKAGKKTIVRTPRFRF